MNRLIQKFITGEILRNQKIIDDFHWLEGSKPLDVVGKEKEVPRDVLFARAQLDAFVRIANFLGDEPPNVDPRMSQEEALRTATNLFLNDANKKPFDWDGGPIDQKEALADLNTVWDMDDATVSFNHMVRYWYRFQREK